MSPILMSFAMAMTQSWSNSPAEAPTMVQPRMVPSRRVITLMNPSVSRSHWARSLSA